MSKPRKVRLSTGFEIALDGDLLAVLEALYREVTLSDVLRSSFETMRSEILSLIDKMSPPERRTYLAESLFLNSVTYENEMLSAYARKLRAKARPKAPPMRASTTKRSKKPR